LVTSVFDQLYGFENDDGIFVALKPIVESMGLNWEGQRQRLSRGPILSEGTCMMQVPFAKGGAQDTTCLKMDLVNGWLFTIDSSRIKDEAVRDNVILYQRGRASARPFVIAPYPERNRHEDQHRWPAGYCSS